MVIGPLRRVHRDPGDSSSRSWAYERSSRTGVGRLTLGPPGRTGRRAVPRYGRACSYRIARRMSDGSSPGVADTCVTVMRGSCGGERRRHGALQAAPCADGVGFHQELAQPAAEPGPHQPLAGLGAQDQLDRLAHLLGARAMRRSPRTTSGRIGNPTPRPRRRSTRSLRRFTGAPPRRARPGWST